MTQHIKQPYIPKFQTQSKIWNPDQERETALYEKMYSLFTKGDYHEIHDFIMNNKISMDYIDDDGNNVLHNIIRNSSMKTGDKIELVKLAIFKKVNPQGLNKYNQTPLHFAAEIQSYDIMKILLDHGVDPNIVDSEGKSAVHYAVIGIKTDCPNTNSNKILPLIKKTEKSDDLLDNLQTLINKYISNELGTQDHINYIVNNLKSLSNVFPEQHKNIINKINNIIYDVFADPKISRTNKEKTLLKKLINERDIFLKDISKSMDYKKKMNIVFEKSQDSWKPEGSPDANKILRKIDLNLQLGNLKKTNNKNKIKNNQDTSVFLRKIQTYIESSELYYEKIKKNTMMILKLEQILYGGHFRGRGNLLINKNIFEDEIIFALDFKRTIFNEFFADTPKVFNPNINMSSDYIDLNDNYKIKYNDYDINFTVGDIKTIYMNTKYHYLKPEIETIFKNMINEDLNIDDRDDRDFKEKLNMYIRKHNMGDDSVILNPVEEIFAVPVVDINENDQLNIVQDINDEMMILYNRDDSFYLFSGYKYYYDIFKSNIDQLILTINQINNMNNSAMFENIYDNYIYNIVFCCINIILCHRKMITETQKINDKIIIIRNMLNNVIYAGIVKNNYGYKMLNDLIDECGHFTRQHKNMQDLYSEIMSYVDIMNNIIHNFEMESALKIFEEYHKNIDDNNYDQTTMNNFINKIIKKISLPKTYKEFEQNNIFTDILLTKRTLVKKFIPYLEKDHMVTYYNYDSENRPPREGYLIPNDQQNNYIINNILQRGVDNFGQIQLSVNIDHNKTSDTYPILLSVIPEQIGIIKYRIMEKLLSSLYSIITRGGRSDIQNEIRKIIMEFEKDIEKYKLNGDNNDHSVILTIIGKYFDEFFDKFIEDILMSGSNALVLSVISKNEIPSFYKIYENETQKFIFALRKQNYNVDINEIYDDTIGTPLSTNFGQMIQSRIMETTNNNDKIYEFWNTNYFMINSTQKTCYSFDKKIIKLLSKYRANMNLKDGNGETPLFAAIEMKNSQGVNVLLEHNAFVKSTNNNGHNAYQFLVNKYKAGLDDYRKNTGSSYAITDILVTELYADFKKRNDGNLPIFTKTSFKVALHLFNHHFFTLSQKYYGSWKFYKNERLLDVLNLNMESKLPILDTDITMNELGSFDMILNRIEKEEKWINKNESHISDNRSKMDNLIQEFEKISKKQQQSDYDKERLKNISDMLNEIDDIQHNLSVNVNDKKDNLEDFKRLYHNDYRTTMTNMRVGKEFVEISNSVVDMYNSVFLEVFNNGDNSYNQYTDLISYANLWKKYLDKNTLDYTFFMEHLIDKQRTILNTKYTSKTEQINDLLPIFAYYKSVLNPYIKQYHSEPQEYNNGNECLDIIIEIIEHILKRFTFVTFYYEITFNIYTHLMNSFKYQGSENNLIKKYMNAIFGYDNNNESIFVKYLFDKLPLITIKKTLNIYENEDDMDRDDKTLDDVFKDIVDLLNIDSSVGISLTPIFDKIKDSTIPRYKEYTENIIKNTYSLLNGYINYIYGQSNDICLMTSLLKNYN